MADFYDLLARAVAHLPKSTPETRKNIYDRARKALSERLSEQPMTEETIDRELRSLDDAISRVEDDFCDQDGRITASGGGRRGRPKQQRLVPRSPQEGLRGGARRGQACRGQVRRDQARRDQARRDQARRKAARHGFLQALAVARSVDAAASHRSAPGQAPKRTLRSADAPTVVRVFLAFVADGNGEGRRSCGWPGQSVGVFGWLA